MGDLPAEAEREPGHGERRGMVGDAGMAGVEVVNAWGAYWIDRNHRRAEPLRAASSRAPARRDLGDPGSLDDAVERVMCLYGSAQPWPRWCLRPGAHGLVFARRHAGFRRVLKGFFLNLPDGKPVAWVARRLKGAIFRRFGLKWC